MKATAFIDVLMSYPLKERRAHCNLLFGLDLHKVNVVPAPTAPAGKMGNKNGKTTKPRVTDLGSFELFTAFFARMKTAVNANEFPTLQVLTGRGGSYKSAAQLKARDQNLGLKRLLAICRRTTNVSERAMRCCSALPFASRSSR